MEGNETNRGKKMIIFDGYFEKMADRIKASISQSFIRRIIWATVREMLAAAISGRIASSRLIGP